MNFMMTADRLKTWFASYWLESRTRRGCRGQAHKRHLYKKSIRCLTENSCPSPSLTTRKSIGTKAMVEMSDAAVERLAKKLAEKDGLEWQLEFKQPLPPGTKLLLRPILDDAGRERYRTLAREQCDQRKRG
jgi:hypothetical protein